MRRLFLIGTLLVAGLLAMPSSGARVASRTQGSVELHFYNGSGSAKVRFRGTFLGQVGRGRIVATKGVTVSGCESRRAIGMRFRECRGRDLRFRTPDGKAWRLRISGRHVYAGGLVRGCMTLNGVDGGDTGTYQVGGDEEHREPWPRSARTRRLGWGC